MHAFLGRVEAQMRESALWRRETEAQWEETRESLERIVMHKVCVCVYVCTAFILRIQAYIHANEHGVSTGSFRFVVVCELEHHRLVVAW